MRLTRYAYDSLPVKENPLCNPVQRPTSKKWSLCCGYPPRCVSNGQRVNPLCQSTLFTSGPRPITRLSRVGRHVGFEPTIFSVTARRLYLARPMTTSLFILRLILVPSNGIEPLTLCSSGRRSTTELRRHYDSIRQNGWGSWSRTRLTGFRDPGTNQHIPIPNLQRDFKPTGRNSRASPAAALQAQRLPSGE